jgi:DNA-binding MltR family transcriptional regulator
MVTVCFSETLPLLTKLDGDKNIIIIIVTAVKTLHLKIDLMIDTIYRTDVIVMLLPT